MRRIFWLVLALLTFGTPARSAEPPLFDGHIHYSRPDWNTYTPEQVFAILDQAGIRRALVSSTPDDGTLKLYERAPKRVIPILRPYRTRDDMSTWWKDPTIIPYLEERLAKGVHKGIGEFHIHGKDIRTPVLARITEIAVQRHVPARPLRRRRRDRALRHRAPIEDHLGSRGHVLGRAGRGRPHGQAREPVGRSVLPLWRRGPGRHPRPRVARAPHPPRRPVHARQRHVDDVAVGAGGRDGRGGPQVPQAAPARCRREGRLQEHRAAVPLGACRRNAPTPNLGGTKRIGRIEIVDPEPDARSHSSSQCRQTHYSDTLLA